MQLRAIYNSLIFHATLTAMGYKMLQLFEIPYFTLAFIPAINASNKLQS